jgi:hypothetical protein
VAAPPHLDPTDTEAILAALKRHRVRYVLVGGLAAQTRGWRGTTEEIDITPARDDANLTRLAAALSELEAGFRVDPVRYPAGFKTPGGLDAETFRNQISLAFTTKHGPLDIALVPDGTSGFDDLRRNAGLARIAGTTIRALVASDDDIIRSKSAASRPRDLAQLPDMIADFQQARQLTQKRQGPELER